MSEIGIYQVSEVDIYRKLLYSFMLVEEVERPEIHELPALNIDKAIKATQNYVRELEEMKSTGLTNKQAERFIKFTQELTSAVDNEE